MSKKNVFLISIMAIIILVNFCLAAKKPATANLSQLLAEQEQLLQQLTPEMVEQHDPVVFGRIEEITKILLTFDLDNPQTMSQILSSQSTDNNLLKVNGSGMTGTVQSEKDHMPISNTLLKFFLLESPFTTMAITDINGNYKVKLLPGTYKVFATGQAFGFPMVVPNAYMPRFYLNKPTKETAEPVVVEAGKITENIDFLLSEGGVISGNVFDQLTGAPLPALCMVIAFNLNTMQAHIAYDFTPFKSGYRITGLNSGNYIVVVDPLSIIVPPVGISTPTGLLPYDWEVYNNEAFLEDADLVRVVVGEEVPNIDFYVTRGGRVVGMVRDDETLQRLCNAKVILFDQNWVFIDSDVSNQRGRYKLEAPKLGKYYIYANGWVDGLFSYEPEYFWNDAGKATANPVFVTKVGIRFEKPILLHQKDCLSKVAGNVWNDANGNGIKDPEEIGIPNVVLHLCPIPGGWQNNSVIAKADVVFTIDGDDECSKAKTDAFGNYLFKNVPLGHYTVTVDYNSAPTNTTNPDTVDVTECYNTYTVNFGFNGGTPTTPSNVSGNSIQLIDLKFVNGSPSAHEEGWEKAIDGNRDGWEGTATVRGDDPNPKGPAWGIFEFSDGGTYKFNSVNIQTENGEFTKFRYRMATKIEIKVSTAGTEASDFISIATIYKSLGQLENFKLKDYVAAKYIKLILLEPNWTSGGWRQIVEFQLVTDKEPGVKPASENALIAAVPAQFELEQNYPNPFNPQTTIRYHLASSAQVSLKVYDINGREVTTLVKGSIPAGVYDVIWNAENLPTGIYFAKLRAGSFESIKRMLLVK